jgi:hypothetical protein
LPKALTSEMQRLTHAERISALPELRALARPMGKLGTNRTLREALRHALEMYEHEKRRADLLAAAVDCFLAGEK